MYGNITSYDLSINDDIKDFPGVILREKTQLLIGQR